MSEKEPDALEDIGPVSKIAKGPRFEKGNQFWKLRATSGRKPKFASPEELEEKCIEYFCWVEDNPLITIRTFHAQGLVTRAEEAKPRYMSLTALRLHIGISDQGWREYRAKADFSGVTEWVDEVIRTQKLEGAAADLFNANIVARELGLADKKDHGSSDGSMSPKGNIDVSTMSPELLNELAKHSDL